MTELAREQPPPPPDWTHGPAKWIAAVAIALVSIVGMVWSLLAWPGGAAPRPVNPDVRQPLAATPPREVAARPATPPSASSSSTTSKTSTAADPPSNATDAADSTASSPSTAPHATTPSSPDAPSTPPSTPSARTDNSLVNINTATRAELELLPGIGPSLAQRIIEHREKFGAFHSVDELDRVKGIGSKILERLRPFVRVD